MNGVEYFSYSSALGLLVNILINSLQREGNVDQSLQLMA